MRSYPRNSPEAAARILALVLISDGHVCRSEFETLNQLDGVRHLGLDPQKLPGIGQTFCEDLLMEGFDGRSILSRVGDGLMASLMAEVDDLHLRAQVLLLATSVAHADKHLSEGETAMIDAIRRIWQTSPFKAVAAKAEINLPALAHAGSA
ncbi:MAG: TerB family tellurite resistance protein [Aquabacterium sp.]|nr:TerB family tellurite resistance protein [Aquabacterium sp.]